MATGCSHFYKKYNKDKLHKYTKIYNNYTFKTTRLINMQ